MWESGLIHIERVLGINDPANGQGFLPLWVVFAGPFWPNPANSLALVSPRLSWFTAGLALTGLVAGLAALRSSMLRWQLLVGACMALAAVFMVTPASQSLWRAVPMLRLAHFPFRFLAVANLWLALLAAGGSAALLAMIGSSVVWSRLASAVLVTALCLAPALYLLFGAPAPYQPTDLPVDFAAAIQFEKTSEKMGLLAASEYLPKTVTVEKAPPATSGPAVGEARLDLASLPDGHG